MVLAAIDTDIFGRTTEELRQLGTACHLQKKRAAAKIINDLAKMIPIPVVPVPVPVPVLPDPSTHAGAHDMLLNEPWDGHPWLMEHLMDMDAECSDDADVMRELTTPPHEAH